MFNYTKLIHFDNYQLITIISEIKVHSKIKKPPSVALGW
jgi:hypothetical protein